MTLRCNSNVIVEDKFDVASDSDLASATIALDPQRVVKELGALRPFVNSGKVYCLDRVRVVRHKPGKRCLLEYCFSLDNQECHEANSLVLLGKVRAFRSGKKEFRLQRDIAKHGLADTSLNTISVPKVIAHVKPLAMWLQYKVSGVTLTSLLRHPESIELMPRVAEAAWKIHCATLELSRVHTVENEFSALQIRLKQLALVMPDIELRLVRLLKKAHNLVLAMHEKSFTPIHRDYYPDQIIVSENQARLSVVDFDLMSMGNPALDIGNFIAHLTEHSIRHFGDPSALVQCEQRLLNHYLLLNSEQYREQIGVYAFLSLMRHIAISGNKPERQRYTVPIIEACEHYRWV